MPTAPPPGFTADAPAGFVKDSAPAGFSVQPPVSATPTPTLTPQPRRQAQAPASDVTAPTTPPANVEAWLRKYSTKYGVPYALARAVAFTESTYRTHGEDGKPLVNSLGYIGPMQISTDIGKQFGKDPYDPEQNIEAGIAYLHSLHHQYGGDWTGALAHYGGIPGTKPDDAYVNLVMTRYGMVNREMATAVQHVQQAAKPPPPHAAPQAKAEHDGFMGWVHGVVGNIVNGYKQQIMGIAHDPQSVYDAANPLTQVASRAWAVTPQPVKSALQRASEAFEVPNEAINASIRNMGAMVSHPAPEGFMEELKLHNDFGTPLSSKAKVYQANLPGVVALNQTLLNSNLTLGQKLDAAAMELGVNSPGDVAYWMKQAGVHQIMSQWASSAQVRNQITHAQPTTPMGRMVQLMFAAKADLARQKPLHPHLTAGETFGLEMLNFTPNVVVHAAGAVVKGLVKGAAIGGKYAEAARAGAAARQAEEAARVEAANRVVAKFKSPSTDLATNAPEDLGHSYEPPDSPAPTPPASTPKHPTHALDTKPLRGPEGQSAMDLLNKPSDSLLRQLYDTIAYPIASGKASVRDFGEISSISDPRYYAKWIGHGNINTDLSFEQFKHDYIEEVAATQGLNTSASTSWEEAYPPGRPLRVARRFMKPDTGFGSTLRGGTSYYAADSTKAKYLDGLYNSSYTSGEGGQELKSGYVSFNNPIYAEGEASSTATLRAMQTLRRTDPEAARIYDTTMRHPPTSEYVFKLGEDYGISRAQMRLLAARGIHPGEAIGNRYLASKGYDAVVLHDQGHPAEVVMLGDHQLYDSPKMVGSGLRQVPPSRNGAGGGGNGAAAPGEDAAPGPQYPAVPDKPTTFQPKEPVFNAGGSVYQSVAKKFYNAPEPMRALTLALGRGYDKLVDAVPNMPIIGSRFMKYSQKYGPLGEEAARALVRDHAIARTVAKNQVMNFYTGLDAGQQRLLNETVDNLAGLLSGKVSQYPPEITVPVDGASILERAMKISQANLAHYREMKRLFPQIAKNMIEPVPVKWNVGVLGNPVEKELMVVPYAPRFSTWQVQQTIREAGLGKHGNSQTYPYGTAKRALGPLGTEATEGKQLSEQWNPPGDLFMRYSGNEHLLATGRHIQAGRRIQIPGTKDFATMDIIYSWPGGEEFPKIQIPQDDGTVKTYDFSKPFPIGKYAQYVKARDLLAAAYRKANPEADSTVAEGAVERMASKAWRLAHPDHSTVADRILGLADLHGLGIEHTYLQQVADANPRIRYMMGVDGAAHGPSKAGLETFQRAFSDLLRQPTAKGAAGAEGAVGAVQPGAEISWEHLTPEQRSLALHFASTFDHESYVDKLVVPFDTYNSMVQSLAMANQFYHVPMNVAPALWSLLAEHAATNPVKLAKYSVGMTKALMGALYHSVDENVGATVYRNAGLPSDLKPPQMLPKVKAFDTPKEWFDHAQASGAFSHYDGLGLPAYQYVRLMSLPFEDLTRGEQFMRQALLGAEWNKRQVFEVQEPHVIAYAHHVLSKEEGIEPRKAATMIRKAVGDFDNGTGAERSIAMSRWFWFYNFMRSMMRYGGHVLTHAPQIPNAMHRGVQTNNQMFGNFDAPDTILTMGHNPDGSFSVMPMPFAVYRYTNDVADLATFGGGNSKQFAKTLLRLPLNHQAPIPALATRALFSGIDEIRNEGRTPVAFDTMSGLYDTQASGGEKVAQAASMVGSRFLPYGLSFNTFDDMPSPIRKKVYGAAQQLRGDAKAMKNRGMDARLIKTMIDTAERLENPQNEAEALAALRQAQVLTRLYRRVVPAKRGLALHL